MNPLLTKVPPHDTDMEESILSSLFINNAGFEKIEHLKPDDFYKGSNRIIYKAMLSLISNKEPVDLMTVKYELEKSEALELIGGARYLIAISDQAPVATNIESYANAVMNYAKARELIIIANSIVENGFNVKDVEEYISESQSKILQVQTSISKDKFYGMENLMLKAVDRIEKAQASKIKIGLNFGMPKLDKYMQNWGSKLILLAGRPGMGKTSLALSIAKYLGYQGDSSGILSIEMDKEQYVDKMISVEADVNSMGFYINGFLSKKSLDDIDMAVGVLSDLPITINDSESSLDDVKRRCRKFKKMGKKIIIIDQLSQIRYEKGLSPYIGISKNCTAIKQLTKELNIPILLLVQLNRELEKRHNKRPIMSDLAETGRLEQDADMILFLYREGVYDSEVDQSRTEIILAKNRQGEKGVEKQVVFIKKRGMFQMNQGG